MPPPYIGSKTDMKKLLENKAKGYELIQSNSELQLNALCGGIGMYISKIILTARESALFCERGEEFIAELASDINKNTAKYQSRLLG